MVEKIWFKDFPHFFTKENYMHFFPSKGMSFAEQLNALTRLSIYFSIVIFVIKQNTHIFFVPIFMAGFTYFLYTIDSNNKKILNLIDTSPDFKIYETTYNYTSLKCFAQLLSDCQ